MMARRQGLDRRCSDFIFIPAAPGSIRTEFEFQICVFVIVCDGAQQDRESAQRSLARKPKMQIFNLRIFAYWPRRQLWAGMFAQPRRFSPQCIKLHKISKSNIVPLLSDDIVCNVRHPEPGATNVFLDSDQCLAQAIRCSGEQVNLSTASCRFISVTARAMRRTNYSLIVDTDTSECVVVYKINF